MLFLHHSYNSSFEGTSIIKICKIEPPDLLFIVVFISFISADIIFQKYLGLHLTLSEKEFFRHEFSFFNRFTNPPPSPHPLNSQNPLSVTKVFGRCSLAS